MINDQYEPVWVSLRPVPIVRIDFGNGNVVTRTLHGNIATYVCDADARVIDILPGIYEPSIYCDRLTQLWWLHRYAHENRDLTAFLRQYHMKQAALLAKHEEPMRVAPMRDMSKAAIEITLERILEPAGTHHLGEVAKPLTHPNFDRPGQLPRWSKLFEDTKVNERARKQIHDLLAAQGPVRPDVITKKVYREILHADLDDPYLGLGETLFATYPFREDVPIALRAK